MEEVKTAEEIIDEHSGDSNITIGDMVRDIFDDGNVNYMKIKVEKVVKNGLPHRKILDWSNCMTLANLPKRYREDYPFFYELDEGKRISVVKNTEECYTIKKEEAMLEEDFQKTLAIMKEAGDRLHKIRREIKRMEDIWSGTMEINI